MLHIFLKKFGASFRTPARGCSLNRSKKKTLRALEGRINIYVTGRAYEATEKEISEEGELRSSRRLNWEDEALHHGTGKGQSC